MFPFLWTVRRDPPILVIIFTAFGSKVVVTPSLEYTDRLVHCFFVFFLFLLFVFSFSFLCYATNPDRAAFDNPSDKPSSVAPTDNHRPSNDKIRWALQPLRWVEWLPHKAYPTNLATGTEAIQLLAGTPSSAAAFWQVLVICFKGCLHNNWSSTLESHSCTILGIYLIKAINCLCTPCL